MGEIASIRAEFMDEWAPRLHSDEVPISPYRVFSELAAAVDVSNTIITVYLIYVTIIFKPFIYNRRPFI